MDRLITFKTAKFAKEKGFDIYQKNVYVETLEHTLEMGRGGDCTFPAQEPRVLKNRGFDDWHIVHCQAPSQSVLQKWLREEYNIHIWVSCKTNDDGKTIFIPHGRTIPDTIKNRLVVDIIPYSTHNTYEQAIEEALVEALNLI